MKIYLLVIITFIVFIKTSFSSDKDSLAYSTTENLKYLMYYGWIDGGYATLSLTEDNFNENKVFHATLHAKTSGITDRLYHVSDIYESYFIKETGLPKLAIRNVSEGRYRDYNEVEFFHNENYIVSQKSGKVEVPENSLDIISSFYYARNIIKNTDLEKDSIIRLDTYFGDEIFPLLIRYVGVEIIETDLGKISCLKFMPITEVGRVFKTEDDMTIWFSNDGNILPIRVKFELLIGSLKCDLIEFSGLKYDLKFIK